MATKEQIPIEDLENQPFLLLEHGGKTEVSDLLDQNHIHPDIRYTTWEAFSIMAMVEKGLGIGILPEMILRRIPYDLEIHSLEKPYYRQICLAMKKQKTVTPATEKFMEYLMKEDL